MPNGIITSSKETITISKNESLSILNSNPVWLVDDNILKFKNVDVGKKLSALIVKIKNYQNNLF